MNWSLVKSLIIFDIQEEPLLHQLIDNLYKTIATKERPPVLVLLNTPLSKEAKPLLDASVHAFRDQLDASVFASPEMPLPKPDELVVFYDPSPPRVETVLFKKLQAIDPEGHILRKQFSGARGA